MKTRRRIDDSTAIIDWAFAHASLFLAAAICVVAIAVPPLRAAVRGAALIGIISAVRLFFHPLRFTSLSRVYVEGGRVLVAPVFGVARAVEVIRVEHDGHSPWPCVLHLSNGDQVRFVARRDDGFGALFDLEPSDRARYERPSDARESLTDLELTVRR
jgi:hypothetical protein